MKVSKIFAGMSAMAIAATMCISASADEAPVENQFYNATGTWTEEYKGADLKKAADDGGAQFGANEDGTYTFGCNIQVGHVKNAKVTLEVTSSKNNLFNGADADAVNSTYMYTVQASWNADAPADKEKTTVKWTEDTKKGATDVNNWDSGPTKYNGQWAQFVMTDDDLDAITIKATIVADGDSTWEYHAIDPEKSAEENVYEVFRFLGAPNTVTTTVAAEEINKQIEPASGDDSKDDNSSTDKKDDSKSDTKTTDNNTTGGNTTGGNTAGGNDNAGNANGTGTGDATGNTNTGASAGLALAGLALAGAAVVVSKKR